MFIRRHARHCKRLKSHLKEKTFLTAAGAYVAAGKAVMEFSLPDMNDSKVITWSCYLDDTDKIGYDAVIGQDLMTKLGISINFKEKIIQWDDIQLPIREKRPWAREIKVMLQQSV